MDSVSTAALSNEAVPNEPVPPTVTQRRLSWFLLTASLLLLATLVGALVFAPAHAVFAPHPDHPSMLQSGGDGSHAAVGWGYAVGTSILLLMTVCILLGVSKMGRIGGLGRFLIAGCVLILIIFTCLVVTYDATGTTGDGAGLVGGFPAATAWMIYGIWWFPATLILAMAYAFRRVWLTEDDVRRFRDALATEGPADEGDE